MKCTQCETEFDSKFCPECGSKMIAENSVTLPPIKQSPKSSKALKKRKPFFLHWWFILIVIISIIAIVGKFGNNNNKRQRGGENIDWSKIALGDMIPDPPSKTGKVYENSDEQLRIYLDNISDSDYNNFQNACIDMGFTVDANKTSNSYKAHNSKGYCLNISHYNSKLSLTLEAPMKLSTITWPNSIAGKQLPTPKSTIGKFSYEYEDHFFVYIGNTTKTEYDEYVTACSNMGFNVDYDKGGTHYYAKNPEGWRISLNYQGNSIMSINIDSPDKEENTKTEETTKPEEPTKSEEPTKQESTENTTDLDPDFKETMDSYEAFFDEYCKFMKKYKESPSDLSLLKDYTEYMSKYSEAMDKLNKLDTSNLSSAELKYYMEVMNRINQKLAELL